MQPPIQYKIRIKLVRAKEGKSIDFINDSVEFVDQVPINARNKAIQFYESYLDILQEEGISDPMRIPEKFTELGFANPFEASEILNIPSAELFQVGIRLNMVINMPFLPEYMSENRGFKDQVGDEVLIHGQGILVDAQSLMDGLDKEVEYYNHYGLDKAGTETTVPFYEGDNDELADHLILETPFDWTGYDEPYFEVSSKESLKPKKASIADNIKTLIEAGEGPQVEFKPSLLFYYNEDKDKKGYSMHVGYIIAKAICAFLNSNGGALFIGVQDNGSITGLSDDFSLNNTPNKNPEDYFLLEVDKLIRTYFKSFKALIYGSFYVIDGVKIFAFMVEPSSQRPSFIEYKYGKEFYVRMMASSEPYKDPEDIANYCIANWGLKN